jgi:hypothetical protein
MFFVKLFDAFENVAWLTPVSFRPHLERLEVPAGRLARDA